MAALGGSDEREYPAQGASDHGARYGSQIELRASHRADNTHGGANDSSDG